MIFSVCAKKKKESKEEIEEVNGANEQATAEGNVNDSMSTPKPGVNAGD